MASPLFSPATGYGTQYNGYNYVQTSPSGGMWSTTPATPATSGQVLGSSTSSSSSGVLSTPEQPPTEQSGPSAEELLRAEVDNIFNPVFSLLNEQESQVRSDYEPIPGQIESQYGVSKSSLETEKGTGERKLAQQGTEAGGRKEDALTSATRLYSELNRGGLQRFGGASSAGEAFQSLTAVEQQRRQATIQTEYEGAMQKLDGYKADLEAKFTQSMKELELQKTSAMDTARRDFDNALSEIRQNRLMAESDRANASLQTLQEYRNKIYTINLQNYQFAQQLALNNEASLEYVNNYAQQVANSLANGGTTVANLLPGYTPTTSYGGLKSTNKTQTYSPVGSIKRDEDYLA